MLVDSHCHLDRIDLTPYDNDLNKALAFARAEGVEYFLCVGVDLNEIPGLIAIAEKYPDISVAAGEHPTEHPGEYISVETLAHWVSHPKVIAVGETGLDYYRVEENMAWQHDRFRMHIQVAKQYKKPLVVHTRMAKEDTLRILKEENAQEVGGVLHCFTEDLDMALRAIEMGFYISFSGIVTFKNAKDLQEIARVLPLEKILVETDCPYLAPVPFRGKPNVPAYVRYTAEYIAQLRNIPFEEVARQTTQNFYQLFNLS